MGLSEEDIYEDDHSLYESSYVLDDDAVSQIQFRCDMEDAMLISAKQTQCWQTKKKEKRMSL